VLSLPSRASDFDSDWERMRVAHPGRVGGGTVTRLRRAPRERSVSRGTRAGLLKALGRVLLWCVVVLLLLRGANDLLAVEEPAPAARESRAPQVAVPDDEVRAFAVEFARAYLGWSPRQPGSYARGLEAFAAPELSGSLVPELPERASPQEVGAISVARTAPLDAGQVLVTVAARVSSSDRESTRYLAVPVARDGRGGLVVYDLPSFVAPPSLGRVPAPQLEPLTGGERAQVEDVLERFFRPYLAGRSEELEYLVPAGVRIGALAERHQLVGLVSVALARPAVGRTREVVATVRARDLETRAVYPLRYRVRLVRGDRWYVAAVNNATRGG
jgi:Conjugative transposon protein TcpC